MDGTSTLGVSRNGVVEFVGTQNDRVGLALSLRLHPSPGGLRAIARLVRFVSLLLDTRGNYLRHSMLS